jgi:hypothetical protein
VFVRLFGSLAASNHLWQVLRFNDDDKVVHWTEYFSDENDIFAQQACNNSAIYKDLKDEL